MPQAIVQRCDRDALLEAVADDGRVALGGEHGRDGELVVQRARRAEGGTALGGGAASGGEPCLRTGTGCVDHDGDTVRGPRLGRLGRGREAGDQTREGGDEQLGHTYESTTYDGIVKPRSTFSSLRRLSAALPSTFGSAAAAQRGA